MALKDLDTILLSEIRKGDEEAFSILFREYYAKLCRFAYVYLKDRDASEEIVLSVFTRVWKNSACLDRISSIRSYLFRSVRNRCLNWIRDRVDTVCLDESMTDLLYIDDFSSIEYNELDRFIEEAIMSLPDRCRDVFVKSRMQQMSHKEIARELNISTKTVEAQITKAIRKIKEYLSSNN